MNEAIDLRSDTVARPSGAMRKAMAAAPVGDGQHLDVSREACMHAAGILLAIVEGGAH